MEVKSNTWITSDHHFGHSNILRFQPRLFDSVEAHDEYLINAWNSRVQPSDTVYHLGDLTMRTQVNQVMNILIRLNGTINFIPGNHDYWQDKFTFSIGGRFNLLPLIHTLRHNGRRIILCHYALKTWERKENKTR